MKIMHVEDNETARFQTTWEGYDEVSLLSRVCHEEARAERSRQKATALSDLSWNAFQISRIDQDIYRYVSDVDETRLAAAALGNWFGKLKYGKGRLGVADCYDYMLAENLAQQINTSSDCQAEAIAAFIPAAPAPAIGFRRFFSSLAAEEVA